MNSIQMRRLVNLVDSAYYAVYNRLVAKYFLLRSDLKKHVYYEVEDRILHAVFNEFRLVVEEVFAWEWRVWHGELGWRSKLPHKIAILFPLRDPESGLKYLSWRANLIWTEADQVEPEMVGKPHDSASEHAELISLYKWWTQVRRVRIEPFVRDYPDWILRSELDALKQYPLSSGWQYHKEPLSCDMLGFQIEELYAAEDRDKLKRLVGLLTYLST